VNGSRDLLFFKFWDLLHIPGTAEARNFKFGTDWPLGVVMKKCKITSKGVVKGSRDILFEILVPPPYLGNG